MIDDVPDLDRRGTLSRFFLGVRYPFRGMVLVLTRPGTWPFLLVPTILTAAAFATALYLAWILTPTMLAQSWTPPPGAPVVVGWMWDLQLLLIRVLAFMGLALGLYFTAGLVAVPFNDRLSDKVERMCLGPRADDATTWTMIVDVVQSVSHSAVSMLLYVSAMVSLFVLELVPGFGSFAHLLLGALATALFIVREMMDGAMSRRRMRYGHKIRVLRANLPVVLGFGLVASVLLWVPLMNFVFMPMMVAGGTLLYCHLELAGAVPHASRRR